MSLWQRTSIFGTTGRTIADVDTPPGSGLGAVSAPWPTQRRFRGEWASGHTTNDEETY